MLLRVATMQTGVDLDLKHPDTDRAVPVRLWLPEGPTRGWILFSVGFGGERSGYAYLGRAWAERGLATAVIEHVGSNLDVLKSLPGKHREERNREVALRVGDKEELAARPRDLILVYSHLEDRIGDLPLGLAGHSFGTYTVLAAQGLATVPVLPPLERSLDSAASCMIISPQPPGVLFTPRVLGGVSPPTLVVTGTKDGPLHGDGDYHARAAVYDHLPAEARNLVVLDGVEHMAFANIGLGLAPTLRAVEGLTLAWWESTLFEDPLPAERRAVAMREAGGDKIKGDYR